MPLSQLMVGRGTLTLDLSQDRESAAAVKTGEARPPGLA